MGNYKSTLASSPTKDTSDLADQDYTRMSLEELANEIKGTNNLVVVCGAGLSCGVAPLAQEVRHGLLLAVESLADGITQSDHACLVEEIENLNPPYLTLELFVSGLRHRVPALEAPLRQLYDELFRLPELNHANQALGRALQFFQSHDKQAVVLNANFDDGLTRSLTEAGISEYRLITQDNVHEIVAANNDQANGSDSRKASKVVDICAYHGTIQKLAPDGSRPSPPTSMTARSLAHPFSPDIARYIQYVISRADLVLFLGHRGEDFYDLNVELRRIVQRGVAAKAKFRCVPHMGNVKEVNESYAQLYGKSGVILLKNVTSGDWIGELLDLVSGHQTSPQKIHFKPQEREEIFLRMLALVSEHSGVESHERSVIKLQCRALLDDIKAGTLAAWSVIEHYRLESLGYTQNEIAAFGRAPPQRKYFGLSILELITLQKDYQAFRNAFAKLSPENLTFDNGTVKNGLELAHRMESFAMDARKAIPKISNSAQKAIAFLLAAIPYDYCGLVGMRLMKVFQVRPSYQDSPGQNASLDELLGALDKTTMEELASKALADETFKNDGNGIGWRTEVLFRTSAKLAQEAGKELAVEATRLSTNDQEAKIYADNLSQIVGWRDWELAPTENRLRLSFLDASERLNGYRKMIDIRMERMTEERGEATAGERSFSAAADAAQCAVRVCEVARLLANVSDVGVPQKDSKVKELEVSKWFLGKIPEMARECMRVAAESSSIPNWLIMQAYDALLLESLLTGRGNERAIIQEAEDYGKHEEANFQYKTRLEQMKTRIAPSDSRP